MWPFRRKKTDPDTRPPTPPCPHCGSRDTRLVVYHGGNDATYVKVWRGQRSVTCRCSSCGQDFYGQEPPGGMTEEAMAGPGPVDDEEALRAAEEEVRREAEEERKRRIL